MGQRGRSFAHWLLQGLTFCVFLVGGLFLFSGWKTTPSEIDESQPLLSVEESDLDLGTIWEQANHQISIRFRNRTDREVIVADLQPSCNCTTLTPRTFSLQPGGAPVVGATIDLLKSVPENAELEAPFMVTLEARIVRPRETLQKLAVKGMVRRSLIVRPRQISLIGARELIDGVLPETISLEVEPKIELESLAASVSQRVGSARCFGPMRTAVTESNSRRASICFAARCRGF
jgi:hypothetical protein